MLNRHGRRGQSLPFWVMGVVTALTLSLFIMNYTNAIRWHIRAQNAADAAALAALAGEASLLNQRSIAQYALAFDEYRIRSIIISMVNGANAFGASSKQSSPGAVTQTCDPNSASDDTGIDCDNAYDQLPQFYDQAVSKYVTMLRSYEKLSNPSPPPVVTPAPTASGVPTPAPLPSAPTGSSAAAAFSIVQSDKYCWDQTVSSPGVFDCAFYYNADLSQTGTSSNEVVDVVACRSVTIPARAIFGGILGSSFNAVGRAAATLMAVTESFSPGTSADPNATPGIGATSPPYASVENCPPSNGPGGGSCDAASGWFNSQSYNVDFSGFTVTATFYIPVLTAPKTNPNWTLACKQG